MKLHIKKFDELSLTELYEILKVRAIVFVVEQSCSYLDMDDEDQTATHLFFTDDDENIIAYLRILPAQTDNHVRIGRVLSTKRRAGLATRLMTEAIQYAQETLQADGITLNSQTYITNLYEKLGFKTVGEPFFEIDIPHITMRLTFE